MECIQMTVKGQKGESLLRKEYLLGDAGLIRGLSHVNLCLGSKSLTDICENV